ncbi:MAG: hypothetical protein GC153_03490 [Alphaproteobacteria bacterium]|nr:hypothetical protein [Alphaproteobacteria bacterium]
MDWLSGLWTLLSAISSELAATPPRIFAAAWGLGVLSTLVFYVALAALRFAVSSRRMKTGRKLCVCLTNEDGTVRLNGATIERLGLTRARGQRVIVTSLRPAGKSYRRIASSIENLGWRADQTLKAGVIEISERSAAKLWKGQAVNSGDEVFLDLKRYQLSGFADYWMNPEPRTRFANRFAVYLTALVFLVQIVVDRTY